MDWTEGNCYRCVKHERKSDDRCELADAIAAAYCTDGTISRAIADRLGMPKNTWSEWYCKELEPLKGAP